MNAGAGNLALSTALVGTLGRLGQTVGTAESITGGLIAASLTSVPGASAVFVGGIVAYSAGLKAALLGVPASLLDQVGTVHPDVAAAMARGARDRLGASVAVATTGVAGPDPVGAIPAGIVHVAVSVGDRVIHRPLSLAGSREQIRHETVTHALTLLAEVLAGLVTEERA